MFGRFFYSFSRQSKQKVNVDELERIPSVVNGQELTFEVYQSIKSYLAKVRLTC